MSFQEFYLLQENGDYLLQENGGRLIIGQTSTGSGGGPAGDKTKSIQKGVSAVKKQLLEKISEPFTGWVKGKLLVKDVMKVSAQIGLSLDQRIPKGLVTSKLVSKETVRSISKIAVMETLRTESKLFRMETGLTKCIIPKHPSVKVAEAAEKITLASEAQSRIFKEILEHTERVKLESVSNEKQAKREQLLRLKKILTEEIKPKRISVDLNADVHQRGDLMRITANTGEVPSNLYLRIIDDKGMIVQKAGQVKSDATGFQILAGTRDLKAGKYTVQVSTSKSFTPLGVAEFQIKGESPITPALVIIPGLLTPDSPQEFEKVVFRTMMDSKVDAQCRQHQNKTYNINDRNIPIPPLHFNCRCWLEGAE